MAQVLSMGILSAPHPDCWRIRPTARVLHPAFTLFMDQYSNTDHSPLFFTQSEQCAISVHVPLKSYV